MGCSGGGGNRGTTTSGKVASGVGVDNSWTSVAVGTGVGLASGLPQAASKRRIRMKTKMRLVIFMLKTFYHLFGILFLGLDQPFVYSGRKSKLYIDLLSGMIVRGRQKACLNIAMLNGIALCQLLFQFRSETTLHKIHLRLMLYRQIKNSNTANTSKAPKDSKGGRMLAPMIMPFRISVP